jgi:RNA polymerase sigma-70 factor (ECF subfamily)
MAEESEKAEERALSESFAASSLSAVLYGQLKSAARVLLLSRRHSEQSLTPSSLVHDAWLRLTATDRASWRSEGHFRAAAATAMRHILIDRARRKKTDKHGLGWTRVTLSGLGFTPIELGVEPLADALERLGSFDQRGASIVEMRFLAGMSNADIATVLSLSERTVERDWRAARAWLLESLRD